MQDVGALYQAQVLGLLLSNASMTDELTWASNLFVADGGVQSGRLYDT